MIILPKLYAWIYPLPNLHRGEFGPTDEISFNTCLSKIPLTVKNLQRLSYRIIKEIERMTHLPQGIELYLNKLSTIAIDVPVECEFLDNYAWFRFRLACQLINITQNERKRYN